MGQDISVGDLIVGIKTQMTEFKKGMTEAGGSFDTLKKKTASARKGINDAGKIAAGAGAAIAAGLAVAVKSTATFADNIEKMSARTGESAETLSALAFAADRGGTSIQSVENALKRAL